MATMNGFHLTNWSDSIAIHSTRLCDLQQTRSEPAVRFIVYHNGERESFIDQLDGFVGQGNNPSDATKKRRRELAEQPTLLALWSEEIRMFFPSDKSYKYFSSVFENNEDTTKAITSLIKVKMGASVPRATGSAASYTHSFWGGRQAGRQASNATAFLWRKEVCYISYIMVRWKEKWKAAFIINVADRTL
jgi:hypothetical protein